ncbi:pyridoxal phosphate-dependent transferase [Cantharellus anzutake]|uniref:pyridoxal phosphate-dependent transferase n=1 Tax=Cantharellus anzutake TaxID=1750568 RepID=UPI001907290C|nr:pyridoxal phosphate-dependent transferase [Cantharellus anzutake]KAF8342770.1 pyridoxal phosphate-dependent transferase [Cantharellus anzutake]
MGAPIPSHLPHGISVSLPTWKDNIGYEESDPRVVNQMQSGYPRFFINLHIRRLERLCEKKFGLPGERCHLFPSSRIAQSCRAFMHAHSPGPTAPIPVRIAQFMLQPPPTARTARTTSSNQPSVELHIVLFPLEHAALAKSYWQHTGNGISSRLAEYCLSLLPVPDLIDQCEALSGIPISPTPPTRNRFGKHYGNKRDSLRGSGASTPVGSGTVTPKTIDDGLTPEFNTYLEERYGRNLALSNADLAKRALRRRIAGIIAPDEKTMLLAPAEDLHGPQRSVKVTEHDVFLFPAGMSAIWHAHQLALAALPPAKSVCFGFPYTDTYKILQKWGRGCHFFGHGLDSDIDSLAELLKTERGNGKEPPVLALFCEFPSNPLLRSPNLLRLRELADEYGFLIVVDETLGNFANVEVLPLADIVVSSLSKIFSGEVNVMGGSLVLNPSGNHYPTLKETLASTYEDNYWIEDAIYMERNSRDLQPRVDKINLNTEYVCELLRSRSQKEAGEVTTGINGQPIAPVIKEVFYPKWVTPENFEACRIGSKMQVKRAEKLCSGQLQKGGWGGLFSVTFTSDTASEAFFDALSCDKGPSLGTNFTLACPYTILAHYNELDWAAEYGVERGLVRVSIGLEDEEELESMFMGALGAAERAVRVLA